MHTKIASFFLCAYLATVAAAADFSADPSINVSAIYAASLTSAVAKTDVIVSFPATSGGDIVQIQGDWLNLDGVSAYHFTCRHGRGFTSAPETLTVNPKRPLGLLDAASVPWYVIPQTFWDAHQDIKPNALGAIICDGKMFYGIFGDTNGDDPEVVIMVILRWMCSTSSLGLKYPQAVGKEKIDIGALKTLGDEQVQLLEVALGGSGSANSTTINV
ncbi:hypothetical protein F5146DRAFT_1143771 [Armillaria mellea]|nr:hypothetical protein F5146DRAFT_1143771 [Armillaria mellea]